MEKSPTVSGEDAGEVPASSFVCNLPDEIVINIISFISVIDAVRFCSLNRRWVNLWRSITTLDFDSTIALLPNREAVIDQIFLAHDPLVAVDCCRIVHGPLDIPYLLKWMEWVAKLGVRKLKIEASSTFFYPFWEFEDEEDVTFSSIPGLREVDLYQWHLITSKPFTGCTGLRALRLHRCTFLSSVLSDTIQECPKLQLLSLCSCMLPDNLDLLNPDFLHLRIENAKSMRHLEIVDVSVDAITIRAPSLQNLTLASVSCRRGVALDAPALQTLGTFRLGEEDGFSCIDSVELLEIWSGIYQKNILTNMQISSKLFMNLKALWININMRDIRQLVILGYVLQQCVCLKELIIKNEEGYLTRQTSVLYTEFEYWRRFDYCDCFDHSLTNVTVQNYTGDTYELDFIRSLMIKAQMLARIKLIHSLSPGDVGLEATMFMLSLSLPWASPRLQIYMQPESEENVSRQNFRVPLFLQKWLAYEV